MKPASKNIKCVIYARLSQEDGYDERSMSINTQIDMCTLYAKKNNLIIKEIVYDDGYSGTNFNRPGFQKVIELIETKQINCILLKDLSRLGRNFLKVSEYVEEYFPRKNVRLISINDNYDSDIESDEELTVAIRNFLNGYYVKESRKKFLAAIKNKSTKRPLNSKGYYGYKLVKKRKERTKSLVIDEEAAEVVKRIFNLFISGKSTGEIVKQLHDERVLAPLYHMQKVNGWKFTGVNVSEDDLYKWNRNTILDIIKNPAYLGHTINFKDKEEKIFLENTHEPIIPIEIYNKAQPLRKEISKPKDYSKDRLYKILYASDGNLIGFSGTKNFYYYYYLKESIYINAEALHTILYKECINYLKKYKESNREFLDKHFKKIESEYSEERNKKIYHQINKYESKIQKLFEKFAMGELSETDYELELGLYNIELERLKEVINELAFKRLKVRKEKELFNEYINNLDNINNNSDRFKIIYTIISKVIINKLDDKEYKLDIEFKYDL